MLPPWANSFSPSGPAAHRGHRLCGGAAPRHLGPVTGGALRGETLAAKLQPETLLHGNETIILLLRPSLWYIAASSVRFCALVILLAMLASRIGLRTYFPRESTLLYIAALLVGLRLMYAVMDWISHLYLLTNCRVVTIKGARHPEIFQASLSKISAARLERPVVQKCLGVGTISFATDGEARPESVWHWISHPERVHQQIIDALRKRGAG